MMDNKAHRFSVLEVNLVVYHPKLETGNETKVSNAIEDIYGIDSESFGYKTQGFRMM